MSEYLNEVVVYGGKLVSRGHMISDLQEQAKTIYPNDDKAQTRLVNAYLFGREFRV